MTNEISWLFQHLKNKDPFCYVRFNDGEMMGICMDNALVARGDQIVGKDLKEKLKKAIIHRQKNYYVGIPCSRCYPEFNKVAKHLTGDYKNVKSAVALTNRNWKQFYDNFPSAMKDRKILWIGGKDQDPERLKDYGLNIVKTIRVPNRNSWNYYDSIKTTAEQFFSEVDVVCVSLGPTARILCSTWFQENDDMTFLDMGSLLDPITRNVHFGAHKGWDTKGFNLVPRCEECN